MKMRHVINDVIPKGSYRIICSACGDEKEVGNGGFTQANVVAMRYPVKCKKCGGELILETNPDEVANRYNKEHPYPQDL